MNEQEQLWSGDFGNAYIERNNSHALLASNTALFSRILARTHSVHSVLELGANIGMNLKAIRALLPEAHLTGVEINATAAVALAGVCESLRQSIFDPAPAADLVLSKGVLIHIHPDNLPRAYESIYRSSNHYVCLVEYYNPSPVSVQYRGLDGYLFKRDFAGEMIENYGLTLLDYGFAYHRDPNFPQDDMTWFLLEKSRDRS